MKWLGACVLTAAATGMVAQTAEASIVLAQWTFEQSTPTSAGDHLAELGMRKAESHVKRFAASGSASYSSPAGHNSTNSFSSSHWSANDYYQVRTNTTGYEAISISWSQTRSGNGPSSFHLQWSTDGINFTTIHSYTVTTTWQSFGVILAPSDVNDEAVVYFRMTSPNSAPGGHSTAIDNIIVMGTAIPAPGVLALLGMAGLVSVSRRRRN